MDAISDIDGLPMPHMYSIQSQGGQSIRDVLDWLSLAFGFQVMSFFIHSCSDINMFKGGLHSYPSLVWQKVLLELNGVYVFFGQKSNVENQRENMVLLLANISTRTAGQEGHPLVRSMLL
jgi:callose synthase